MDASVFGLIFCLTLNIGGVIPSPLLGHPEVCVDPDAQLLIDVQNSCTSTNATCNIMMPETCELNVTCTVLGMMGAVNGGNMASIVPHVKNATQVMGCPFDAETAERELRDEGYTREGALIKQMPNWEAALRCVQQVIARCFMSAASPCLHRSVHYGSRYRDEAASLECLARKFKVSFKRIEVEP